MRRLALLLPLLPALLLPPAPLSAQSRPLIPPIKAEIADPANKPLGTALIYPNFVEVTGLDGVQRGAIGVVLAQGRATLYLVRADNERRFIGWAEDHKLYNTEDQLVGYYFWTPIWSYVYDPKMKKLGQAQCLAYQGVCAAGVAGYLLGLL
jgi:hypothetical protein